LRDHTILTKRIDTNKSAGPDKLDLIAMPLTTILTTNYYT